jgi:hypothetical protein
MERNLARTVQRLKQNKKKGMMNKKDINGVIFPKI